MTTFKLDFGDAFVSERPIASVQGLPLEYFLKKWLISPAKLFRTGQKQKSSYYRPVVEVLTHLRIQNMSRKYHSL